MLAIREGKEANLEVDLNAEDIQGISQSASLEWEDRIALYTQPRKGQIWLERFRGEPPIFACVLGFTETGLIPGISAAGATPAVRRITAIADGEFLYFGPRPHPRYGLPPLQAGISPAVLSHALITAQSIPLFLFDAGLPQRPATPIISLGGQPAHCLSQGNALPESVVMTLFEAGLDWGMELSQRVGSGYLILGECVVGGTTTALAVLMGLGIEAMGRVNSSHPTCNHAQKVALVRQGLACAQTNHRELSAQGLSAQGLSAQQDPLTLVAAIGDPMQVAVAGMAIAASRRCGVLLAGGTQMLAVFALTQAIARYHSLSWNPNQIVVGTTRWVAEDQTGDTVGLARLVGTVPLLATRMNFAESRHPALRMYERGFVKEGVGLGGLAIAASLYQNYSPVQLLQTIETLIDRCG